jgi:hypothetical protein
MLKQRKVKANMKKIIGSITLAAVSALVLSGCAGSPAESEAGALTTPTSFSSVSNSKGHFEFTSLADGKNEVDFKTVCSDLFDWAQENKFTRYARLDNTFNLTDYEKEGRPISADRELDGPWIAACTSDVVSNFKSSDADENPNTHVAIIFFGTFGDSEENKVVGSARLKVQWEGKEKYVTLSGDFLVQNKPAGSEAPKDSATPEESAAPEASPTPSK